MPENFILRRALLFILMLSWLSGCSVLGRMFPDRSKEYKKAETTTALDVPPDLTTTSVNDSLVVDNGSATLSGYKNATRTRGSKPASGVLPTMQGMHIMRDKDRSWLVVKGSTTAVWERTRAFWLDSGFLIRREDPALGVLETNWVDSHIDAPDDIITHTISRVFPNAYSSSLRDRYRMRLETGEQPGTTEIYITHQGLQQKLEGASDETPSTVWEPRPSDPGLESEKLKQLVIYLGSTPQHAEKLVAAAQAPVPDKAELTQQGDGQPVLVLHEGFSQAWRSVGITLDRVDFAVEDRDRSAGTYYVRYNDPLQHQKKGFFATLAFWSNDDTEKVSTYQIKLTDDGADTRVVVLNNQGKVDQSSVTPVRILKLLYEALR